MTEQVIFIVGMPQHGKTTVGKMMAEELGVKRGQKLPAKELNAAAKESGKLGQRARLAKTLRSMA